MAEKKLPKEFQVHVVINREEEKASIAKLTFNYF